MVLDWGGWVIQLGVRKCMGWGEECECGVDWVGGGIWGGGSREIGISKG